MNIEAMIKARAALLDEIKALIDGGKIEDSNAKMAEVEELDGKIEAAVKATKNAQALAANAPVVDITAMSAKPLGTLTDGAPAVDLSGKAAGKSEGDIEAAYTAAWCKAMQGHKLSDDESNCMHIYNAAHTTSTTGAVIPETMAANIWDEIGKSHPMWEDVTKTYVKGKLIIAKNTASTDAAWYDEATSTAEGTETMAQIELAGCELARDITVSWLLKEMSMADFVPYITRRMAEKMGAALGYGVSRGRGVPGQGDTWKREPLGIVTALNAETNTPQVISVAHADDDELLDALISCRAKINTAWSDNICLYCNNATIWGNLAAIKDTTGRPILLQDNNKDGVLGYIYGMPVKAEAALLDNQIVVGNPRAYQANVNKDVTMDTDEHKLARTTDYIGYAIVDGAPIYNDAFVLISIAAS